MFNGKLKARGFGRGFAKGGDRPDYVIGIIERCSTLSGGEKSDYTETRGNRVADNNIRRSGTDGVGVRLGGQSQNNVESTPASDAFCAECFV